MACYKFATAYQLQACSMIVFYIADLKFACYRPVWQEYHRLIYNLLLYITATGL